MGIMAFILEYDDILDWVAIHLTHSDIDILPGAESVLGLNHIHFALMLLLNGLMAFFLNYANFQTTQQTSALTVTVAGNVKHMLTIIAGKKKSLFF